MIEFFRNIRQNLLYEGKTKEELDTTMQNLIKEFESNEKN